MVALNTSYRKIKELLGKDISIKELESVLFDFGMELDEVDGDDLKIDITSERPDMVSTQGLARVLRVYYGLKNREYRSNPPKKDYKVIVDSSVKGIRPYTVCTVVENLKFTDELIKEIMWVQEKLHDTFGRHRKKIAIGVYPIENIQFPITYSADKPEDIRFRPLESPKIMTGEQILKHHKTGKKYAYLLEGFKRYPFFKDSKGDILSMPPIINSHDTGKITEKTTGIFIECSGSDLKALSQTLNMLVYLFIDMGGVVYSMDIKYPDKTITTPELSSEKRSISISYINDMIGIKKDSKFYANLLSRMMHKIVKIEKDRIDFLVPPIRTDIWHDADIVDDIVRAYGVNNIEPIVPDVATTGSVLFENKVKSGITDIMVGLGFQEVFTLSLSNKTDQYSKMNRPVEDHIDLVDTVEESISMVRTWLTPEVIKAMVNNRHRDYPQRLFEINYIVLPDKTEDVLSKTVLKMSSLIADSIADFASIKSILVYLFNTLGIIDYSFKPLSDSSFIEGRCAGIIVKGKTVGILGEINPQVITNWDMEMPLCCFELDLYKLLDIDQ